jgi:hypothetical protein
METALVHPCESWLILKVNGFEHGPRNNWLCFRANGVCAGASDNARWNSDKP